MISPLLPVHPALEDALFHFVGAWVNVELMTADADDLSPATEYVLRIGSTFQMCGSALVESWTFKAERWPEVVRLIELTQTDPQQAVYEAWLMFDDSPAIPACYRFEAILPADKEPSEPVRRPRDVSFLRLLARTDPPHHFPSPKHGIEGSDLL